jgi:hypothetical protein
MSDKKQTAVQWLLEQWPILQSQLPSSIIDEALQMEQEQIVDAHLTGLIYSKQAERYYNETYGGKDEN